jgi:hypothetical protein
VNIYTLGGTLIGNEAGSYTCDTTTSLLSFTDAKGKTRILATSPAGLFVAKGGKGALGVFQPPSDVTLTAGDKYLGMLYEPATGTPTTTVGFTVTSATSLAGFDPTTGNANQDSITLGSQNIPGLITGGSLFDAASGDTDSSLTIVASMTNAGKIVLWGFTYDATKLTTVNLLLIQQ